MQSDLYVIDTGRTVRKRTLYEFLQPDYKKTMFLRRRGDNPYKDVAVRRANEYVGIKYDTRSLFTQAWFIITGWWWGPTGERAMKKLYCSELVAWCYREYFNRPWIITVSDIVMDKRFVFVPIERLQRGDIVVEHTFFNPLKNPISILSMIIRVFTGSHWNHAGIIV